MIQTAYEVDRFKARYLLMCEVAEFGDSTCLQIAKIANDLKFIGHKCVQELLEQLWYDKLSNDTSLKRVRLIRCACQEYLLVV